jgi:hypothetical protein
MTVTRPAISSVVDSHSTAAAVAVEAACVTLIGFAAGLRPHYFSSTSVPCGPTASTLSSPLGSKHDILSSFRLPPPALLSCARVLLTAPSSGRILRSSSFRSMNTPKPNILSNGRPSETTSPQLTSPQAFRFRRSPVTPVRSTRRL